MALRLRASNAVRNGIQVVQLRTFLGYAQWSRDQLLGEIARGSWGMAGVASTDDLRFPSSRLWRTLEDEGRLY